MRETGSTVRVEVAGRAAKTPFTDELRKESRQLKGQDFRGVSNIAQPRYDPRTLMRLAELNTWHGRCLRLKSTLIAGLGWYLDGDGPEAERQRVTAVLGDPERGESFSQKLRRVVYDYLAIGNGYLEVSRNRKGELAGVYHLPGVTVRRRQDFSGYVQVRNLKKAEFANFGAEDRGERNEVLHYADYDPFSDYYGVPSWVAAMGGMLLDRAAVESETYFFENGQIGIKLLKVLGGELSKEDNQRLQGFLQAYAKGTKNTGRLIKLSSKDPAVKIEIEDLAFTLPLIQFVRLREFSRDEIVQAHGVPPRLLGIMAAGQLGGGGEVEGQLKIFRDVVIEPEQAQLEQWITDRILREGLEVEGFRFRLRRMDITTFSEDVQNAVALSDAMIVDEDEAREMVGLPAREAQKAAKSDRSLRVGVEFIEALKALRDALEEDF